VDVLPPDSLLFGLASDGKPLLLSLADPRPGPVLVTADRGSGKTHFLKMLVLAAKRLRHPSDVQFALLTSYPNDFAHLKAPDHLRGVWAAYDESASQMLYEFARIIQAGGNEQATVLLVDGLDAISDLTPQAQEDLVYILDNGPQQRIWPLVTANADMIVEWPDWLECFRTRIYGRVNNPRTARAITSVSGAPLESLLPGTQFCLREKSEWLKFWLPTLSV
jgi:hypothetical protein